jgi:hypothetical protein
MTNSHLTVGYSTVSENRDRAILEQIVARVVGDLGRAEWRTSSDCSAHVRLASNTGLVSYVLSSPEWQEARFEQPRFSTFIVTSTDHDDVSDALQRLTRLAVAYLEGRWTVEQERGWFRTHTTLVISTDEGEWRIRKRRTIPPGD